MNLARSSFQCGASMLPPSSPCSLESPVPFGTSQRKTGLCSAGHLSNIQAHFLLRSLSWSLAQSWIGLRSARASSTPSVFPPLFPSLGSALLLSGLAVQTSSIAGIQYQRSSEPHPFSLRPGLTETGDFLRNRCFLARKSCTVNIPGTQAPNISRARALALNSVGGGGTGSYGTVTDEDLSRSITQDLHTRTSSEHSRRTFIQAPTQRIFKILLQGPLEEDFNRIFSQGPVPDHAPGPFQELLARDHAKASGSISLKILKSPQYVRTRSFKALEQDPLAGNFKENLTTTGRQPAQSKCTWTSHKSSFMRIYRNKAAPQERNNHFAPSLRNRNAYRHLRRTVFRENLQEKCRAPRSRCTVRVILHSRNHFTREFAEKMPRPKIAPQTLCEPAQSKCTWTCQFYAILQGKCRKANGAP